jgi:hypothetical protein
VRKARTAAASSSLVVVALVGPGLALAEETYQAEAGLSYSQFRSDFHGLRQKAAVADATYFFDKLPAQPKDTPLDQIQFVERVGSVSANAGWVSNNTDDAERLSNGSRYGAAVDFRRPDMPLVVFLGFDSSDSGKSRLQSVDFQTKAKSYEVDIGTYVGKSTLIALDWTRDEIQFLTTSGNTDLSRTVIGASGQHLMRLPGGDHVAFLVSVAQIRFEQPASTDKNKDLIVQAIYYPTAALGLKLAIDINRGDDGLAEGETYVVGAKMFFTPAFSVSLDYLKFNAKATSNDTDGVMLRAALRF